jgi:hypothetical protein
MPQQATVETAPAATGRRHRVDRWFYISIVLVAILLCVAGFGPSLIDESRRNAPVTPLAIAHGIVSGALLLLFLTQATLAATRRMTVHRRVGFVGPVLAVAMIVLGFLVSIEEFRRGYDLSGDLARVFPPTPFESVVLLVPLAGFANFGVLFAAGLWYRRRANVHKRLMLLAVVPLAAEPIPHLVGHLIGSWPAAQGIAGTIPAGGILAIPLMSVSAIYDRVSTGRIHPVSLWAPILLLACQIVLMLVVFPSVTWRELSTWLIR